MATKTDPQDTHSTKLVYILESHRKAEGGVKDTGEFKRIATGSFDLFNL
jgi:hypothetical protein